MHQCLNCGAVYESLKDLEKGCKDCGGTKFYFSDKPLSDLERKRIGEKSTSGIAKILNPDEKDLDKWLKLEIKDKKEKKEVIEISEEGAYEIDVDSLLKSKPIVVEKEGVYLIYLPSLFEASKKRKIRK